MVLPREIPHVEHIEAARVASTGSITFKVERELRGGREEKSL